MGRITGATFRIVHRAPADTVAIVLGEDLAKGAGIEVTDVVRDGYRIRTLGKRIYIVGCDDRTDKSKILFTAYDGPLPAKATGLERTLAWGDVAWDFERGTLHGVYHFLELLGVRWFFPGPKGTVVPRKESLAVEPLDLREEPHFLLRISGRVIFPIKRYLKRGVFRLDEYDELRWNGRNQRLWTVRQRGSSRFMALNHRPHRHQWSQRFAREHPEYFALQKDDTRCLGLRKGERCYLNYTSDGVFEETIRDIEAYFSGQPPSARGLKPIDKFAANGGWWPAAAYRDTFSLLPNDGLRVDHSPASQRFLHEDLAFPRRHSDYIWQFVDRVARAIEPRFPGKYLTCFAYQTYWEIPQTVKSLPDNVVVGIAALSGASRMNTSVKEAKYREYLDLIERWSRMNKAPLAFWNYCLYRHNQPSRKGVPMLLPRHAGKVFRDLAKYGRYMFMQNDFDNITFEHINRYVNSRLMWDPQQDVEAILQDYATHFYGPAASVMKALLNDIESRCTRIGAAGADSISIWETYFTEESLQDYRQALSRAAELTEGTPHAEAVDLMSSRFVGAMERQRSVYVRDIKKLRDEGADIVRVRRAKRPIVVDGKLNEPEWRRTGGKHLRNNVDGRGTRRPARVRTRHAKEHLYCAFDITAPGVKEQLASSGRKDYVEVFLDVNRDRSTYYWMQVRLSGEVVDYFFPGAGEPPDVGWESHAEVAVKVTEEGWIVEMSIPFSALQAQPEPGPDTAWGGNFCLTRFAARETNDMFSTANPLLRGRFHAPGLFARLIFEE